MAIKDELLIFFDDNNIPYEIRWQDKSMPEDIHILVNGEHGKWEGIALCYEEDHLLVFYVDLGVRVPESKRDRIGRWLLEKNFLYKCGGFFMDPGTGTLITRTSIFIMGNEVERRKLIEQTVLTSGIIADRDYMEIMQKVFVQE